MRIANVSHRLALLTTDGHAVDVEKASDGRFGASPQAIYRDWDEFRAWAESVKETGEPFQADQLGSPAPAPRQVFGVGLNYRAHADESGFAVPDTLPPVFTKYPSAITGPVTRVRLPDNGHTDWEVELVAVLGRHAYQIDQDAAWEHVAGLCVGQDISERITQMQGPAPQFGLGKSFPGFAPMGPWLVTPDEFYDPDDLELGCSINGEKVQRGRTRDLVFSVPALIAKLSAVTTLYPGDVVFTGTPAGVGMGHTPPRYLADGEHLVSYVEGIGELSQTFYSD